MDFTARPNGQGLFDANTFNQQPFHRRHPAAQLQGGDAFQLFGDMLMQCFHWPTRLTGLCGRCQLSGSWYFLMLPICNKCRRVKDARIAASAEAMKYPADIESKFF
jgi:hypothetical protein